MANVCTCCRSPSRVDLDRVLVTGTESIRDVAARFGLGRSAVERHGRTCLGLSDPGSRLHGMAARAELAAVAASAVVRATELLDREETRGNGRGTVAALGALARVLGSAERLCPPADEAPGAEETRALLLALLDAVHDPVTRSAITTGIRARGADDLAAALSAAWAHRPAVLAVTTGRERS